MNDRNDLRRDYERDGFCIARGLFSREEVGFFIAHYMKLRAQGAHPGDMVADTDGGSSDPLKAFPRLIHMHRWDDATRTFLLDARVTDILTQLLSGEPYAVQSMLYFKPPGSRGQALHQDNFYLQAKPGTCMAAWVALDACDEENGCMQLVPASHTWPILCPSEADATRSFTNVTVPLPDGVAPVPALMQPGDCLFFNGSVVHGSFPNDSQTRFRRSLIGHYVEGRAQELTKFDQPVLKLDGSELDLNASPGGGACGTWIERDGQPAIEMNGAHNTQSTYA